MVTLGIDLGTSNSSAAFALDTTIIYVKDPASHMHTFPSSIFALPSGELLVGRLADKQRFTDPERYRQSVKLELNLGETEIPLGQHTYFPSDLAAAILKRLKTLAEQYLGTRQLPGIEHTVLTVPVKYGAYKRTIMQQAAQKAGFLPEQVTFFEEPIAAALGYASTVSITSGEKVMVYDLGGGTFDAAILEWEGQKFRTHGTPDGLKWGGIEFDRLIYRDLLTHYQENAVAQQWLSDDKTPGALLTHMDVLQQCAELKHILSEIDEYTLHIPYLNNTSSLEYRLTRQQFCTLILSKVHETFACCQRVLKSGGLAWQDIHTVLLVGGSCRIPLIADQLRRQGVQHVVLAEDPELAVCRGAALVAVGKTSEKEEETATYVVEKDPWKSFLL